MSTGISISSINQIKELAEQKRYAEALEILDTQNLDKSINPQFLRISGEIFRKNKRYYDSRRILLKAHQMSPQGTRIISELIQLYLELGYFSLANRYYEQYLFYVGQEDVQKEYVEYIVKKANGADIKELASILIPILERMPDDSWNYEAVLLYDKMDRKDKALDESRFILENFKDSIYVDNIILYIDDKLDVDKEFYIYPKEEKGEDVDTFGDLLELEKDILEKDYLAMYPPEARIMVEADDQEGFDVKPVKEKKNKTKKPKKAKSGKKGKDKEDKEEDDIVKVSSDSGDAQLGSESEVQQDSNVKTETNTTEESPSDVTETENTGEDSLLSEEERIQQEREAALEKLLSKKFDAEKIKESAKQIAESVKGIDTSKARDQVRNVTGSVVDNVKKASDALGEAVGTKSIIESSLQQDIDNNTDEIVDGIIESVLEPPKQKVGQVIMNEELDALIPDSLEAMTTDEIAEIEARKEENERLELEALEASLKMEEEKRAKRKHKEQDLSEESESEDASVYSELKSKFIEEFMTEEVPAESLGFITVVHSDVDGDMEENIPDTAQMLRQMIGNKEYYADENSLGFESTDSYNHHGFEVEAYSSKSAAGTNNFVFVQQGYNSDVYKVEDIFVKEPILSFDEMVPDEIVPIVDYSLSDEWVHKPEPLQEDIEEPNIIVEDLKENIVESVDFDFDELTGDDHGPSVIDNHDSMKENLVDDYNDEQVASGDVHNNPDVFEVDVQEPVGASSEIEDRADVQEPVEEVSEKIDVQEPVEEISEKIEAQEPVEEVSEKIDAQEPVEEVSEKIEAQESVEEVSEENVADIRENLNNDFGIFEPVYGEQLSFDIPLERNVDEEFEKAKKARIELRTRILISDDMKKMLLALKETK